MVGISGFLDIWILDSGFWILDSGFGIYYRWYVVTPRYSRLFSRLVIPFFLLGLERGANLKKRKEKKKDFFLNLPRSSWLFFYVGVVPTGSIRSDPITE